MKSCHYNRDISTSEIKLHTPRLYSRKWRMLEHFLSNSIRIPYCLRLSLKNQTTKVILHPTNLLIKQRSLKIICFLLWKLTCYTWNPCASSYLSPLHSTAFLKLATAAAIAYSKHNCQDNFYYNNDSHQPRFKFLLIFLVIHVSHMRFPSLLEERIFPKNAIYNPYPITPRILSKGLDRFTWLVDRVTSWRLMCFIYWSITCYKNKKDLYHYLIFPIP